MARSFLDTHLTLGPDYIAVREEGDEDPSEDVIHLEDLDGSEDEADDEDTPYVG